MAEAEPTVPWWAGSERCPRCLQLYAYEVERRCGWCDGPLCPFCVVTVSTTELVCCTGCGEDEEH
jgi:hypothetical protein